VKILLSDYVTEAMEPGNCYELMFALVAANPTFVLVHGAPVHTKLGVRYGHAWAEAVCSVNGQAAVTWTESTGLVALPVHLYYEAGEIDQAECIRYSAVEAQRQLAAHDHYGPWDSRLKGLLHSSDEDNEDNQEDT
jgi:hypothetical protein